MTAKYSHKLIRSLEVKLQKESSILFHQLSPFPNTSFKLYSNSKSRHYQEYTVHSISNYLALFIKKKYHRTLDNAFRQNLDAVNM